VPDNRKPGELDLADFVHAYLWDECDGEDEKHLASISMETHDRWQQHVRDLLERKGINRYYTSEGAERKQEDGG